MKPNHRIYVFGSIIADPARIYIGLATSYGILAFLLASYSSYRQSPVRIDLCFSALLAAASFSLSFYLLHLRLENIYQVLLSDSS